MSSALELGRLAPGTLLIKYEHGAYLGADADYIFMYRLVFTGHTDHVTALAWEPGSDTLLASASKVSVTT